MINDDVHLLAVNRVRAINITAQQWHLKNTAGRVFGKSAALVFNFGPYILSQFSWGSAKANAEITSCHRYPINLVNINNL